MSFGRNPQDASNLRSFRQSMQATKEASTARRGGGGGGGIPYFIGNYRPGPDLDTLRILSGSYAVEIYDEVTSSFTMQELAYFPFVEHYDGRTKKSCVCSAGPMGTPKSMARPCIGCDLFWAGMTTGPDGRKKMGRMSRSNKFAFSILDHATYHEVEQTDRDGKVRTDASGKPYMHWAKCAGRNCQACFDKKKTKRGHVMPWAMPSTHFDVIGNYEDFASTGCKNCGEKDVIETQAWICQNPDCGDAVIDMSSTVLSDEEINKIVNSPTTCPTCHVKNYLKRVVACTTCFPLGRDGDPATIFDVDIKLRGVESADGKGVTLTVSNTSKPYPLPPDLQAIAIPIDLAKKFAPTPLERQAALFNVEMPERQPVTATELAQRGVATGYTR